MEESSDFFIAGYVKKEIELNPNESSLLVQKLTAIEILGSMLDPGWTICLRYDLNISKDLSVAAYFIRVKLRAFFSPIAFNGNISGSLGSSNTIPPLPGGADR